MLGDSCKEDIENADRVLGLLQDLENVRADRLRIGMLSVASATFQGQKVNSVQVRAEQCRQLGLIVQYRIGDSRSVASCLFTRASPCTYVL